MNVELGLSSVSVPGRYVAPVETVDLRIEYGVDLAQLICRLSVIDLIEPGVLTAVSVDASNFSLDSLVRRGVLRSVDGGLRMQSYIRRIAQSAYRAGDPEGFRQAHIGLGNHFSNKGRDMMAVYHFMAAGEWDRVEVLAQQFVSDLWGFGRSDAVFRDLADTPVGVSVPAISLRAAIALIEQHDSALSLALIKRAVESLADRNKPEELIRADLVRAMWHCYFGSLDEAQALLVYVNGLQMDELRTRLMFFDVLGLFYVLSGRFVDALGVFQSALRLANEVQDSGFVWRLHANIGYVFGLSGHFVDARDQYEALWSIVGRGKPSNVRLLCGLKFVELSLLSGDLQDAADGFRSLVNSGLPADIDSRVQQVHLQIEMMISLCGNHDQEVYKRLSQYVHENGLLSSMALGWFDLLFLGACVERWLNLVPDLGLRLASHSSDYHSIYGDLVLSVVMRDSVSQLEWLAQVAMADHRPQYGVLVGMLVHAYVAQGMPQQARRVLVEANQCPSIHFYLALEILHNPELEQFVRAHDVEIPNLAAFVSRMSDFAHVLSNPGVVFVDITLIGEEEILFGGRSLSPYGFSWSKVWDLIVYLTTKPAIECTKESIMSAIFPGVESTQASSRFHLALKHLRSGLHPDFVQYDSSRGLYVFGPNFVVVTDVDRIRRRVA
ncbi:MAG: tetratricopeptide repeat protein, partial [Chloroflexota bacterium]